MSCVKNYISDRLEVLARESGYDYCFLWDMLIVVMDECAEAGDEFSFDDFAAITRERDW